MKNQRHKKKVKHLNKRTCTPSFRMCLVSHEDAIKIYSIAIWRWNWEWKTMIFNFSSKLIRFQWTFTGWGMNEANQTIKNIFMFIYLMSCAVSFVIYSHHPSHRDNFCSKSHSSDNNWNVNSEDKKKIKRDENLIKSGLKLIKFNDITIRFYYYCTPHRPYMYRNQ